MMTGPSPKGRRSAPPMYGPAVRRKRVSSICRVFGLASMYPASDWSSAPGHHGYQRACVLISRPASSGPFGGPVFASAGKTVLHLVLCRLRHDAFFGTGTGMPGTFRLTEPTVLRV